MEEEVDTSRNKARDGTKNKIMSDHLSYVFILPLLHFILKPRKNPSL
jgi:hypothetical protein